MKPFYKFRVWIDGIPSPLLWSAAALAISIILGITQTVLLYVIVCELHR